jgi:hypothetical protein
MASLAIGPLRVQRLGCIPLLDESVASFLTACASQPSSGLLGSCRDVMNDESVTAGVSLRPAPLAMGFCNECTEDMGMIL